MARNKHSSPTLALTITEEDRDEAIRSNSGGCLIADAIKRQYPHLSSITVDMATIRCTDRKRGERYVYLTPADAQQVLLAFDQEWRHPTETLTIRRAVQIIPVTVSRNRTADRMERLFQLEQREQAGETLTRGEKKSLTYLRNATERPASRGKADVKITDGGANHGAVIRGGEPRRQGPAHPNLLRGRDRHFGARLADPGAAFNEAVEQAVALREAEQRLPL